MHLTRRLLTPFALSLAGASAIGACRSAPAEPAAAGELATFRGDARHTGVYAAPPPDDAWVSVSWRAATHGMIRSSPAVTAAAAYVGSGDGALYAFDRGTGAERWRFDASSPVDASPAVAAVGGEQVVFAATRSGTVIALRASTGALRWRQATGRALPSPPGQEGFDYFVSSPTPAGGAIIVGSADGHLYSFDARTGRRRWRLRAGAPIRSSPAVAGGTAYVGASDGRVYAVDLASGALRWRYDTEGTRIRAADAGFDRTTINSSPAVAEGAIFVGSRDGHLYAIDAERGTLRWRASYEPSWVIGSPAVGAGVVYVTTSDAQVVEALDARTGRSRWRTKVHARVLASPSLVGDVVYVGTDAWDLLALDAGTGTLRWRLTLDAPIHSSVAARDGTLYLGTDAGALLAVRPGRRGPPALAVYWDSASAHASLLRSGPTVRDDLSEHGYQRLGARELAAFMTDRLADRRPSVVVFAQDVLPRSVAPAADDTTLFRRYLNGGGKVVWLGQLPLALARDSLGRVPRDSMGYPTDASFARPLRLLGLSLKRIDPSLYPATPSPAGRRWGLSGWAPTALAFDTTEVSEVLAVTTAGMAGAWVRSYGGPPGTGFVQLWTPSLVRVEREGTLADHLAEIRAVAEYGVLRAP